MKPSRSIIAFVLSIALTFTGFIALPAQAFSANQTADQALQRGYRTGYSDGYMAGYRDSIDNETRDFARHKDYNQASRAYNAEYGSKENYSDGYRQGFESGYTTGFDKKSFEASIPSGLQFRGKSAAAIPVQQTVAEVKPVETQAPVQAPVNEVAALQQEEKIENPIIDTPPTIDNQAVIDTPNVTEEPAKDKPIITKAAGKIADAAVTVADKTADVSKSAGKAIGKTTVDSISATLSAADNAISQPARRGPAENTTSATAQKISYQSTAPTLPEEPSIIIMKDTEMIIELDVPLDTERNRVGDRFTATIVSPVEIAGAKIEGRVDKIITPGRIKRRPQINLSFDRIIINERRWSNFNAMLSEVMPQKGDNVKMVDDEGTAIGKRDIKGDSVKVGAATGAGLGIGAITAGPVGAAVGAGVGAAFGVGAVVVERGKHISLNANQQLRIKTVYETHIR